MYLRSRLQLQFEIFNPSLYFIYNKRVANQVAVDLIFNPILFEQIMIYNRKGFNPSPKTLYGPLKKFQIS